MTTSLGHEWLKVVPAAEPYGTWPYDYFLSHAGMVVMHIAGAYLNIDFKD